MNCRTDAGDCSNTTVVQVIFFILRTKHLFVSSPCKCETTKCCLLYSRSVGVVGGGWSVFKNATPPTPVTFFFIFFSQQHLPTGLTIKWHFEKRQMGGAKSLSTDGLASSCQFAGASVAVGVCVRVVRGGGASGLV